MIKLLLLLLSGAKFGKLLTTGGTMLLSVVAYAWIYGWRYAAGFVFLMFCHEMGHYIAARQRGLAVGLPTFIPFVGAWIQLGSHPHNAETEAYVGIMGPLAGTLATVLCYFWARNEGSQLLLAISYSGFFLNLFNLIPSPPFDGGYVTAAISRRIWFVGVPVMIGLFLWRPSPVLILIVLLAAPQVMRAIKNREEDQQYYNIPLNKRLEYAALYIGLLAYLGVMTQQVHDLLRQPLLQS
ncbi:site-2 protease family protein [Uliginosibacterium gangwonense]|uniref:site-2 protease family protein n=1 Tax=Uliginosibacterium gangwonense TaxID=392736 RepID=UPI00037AFA31|nr:site-2 protease family protein [Uliginosibacterium gangwonense]